MVKPNEIFISFTHRKWAWGAHITTTTSLTIGVFSVNAGAISREMDGKKALQEQENLILVLKGSNQNLWKESKEPPRTWTLTVIQWLISVNTYLYLTNFHFSCGQENFLMQPKNLHWRLQGVTLRVQNIHEFYIGQEIKGK